MREVRFDRVIRLFVALGGISVAVIGWQIWSFLGRDPFSGVLLEDRSSDFTLASNSIQKGPKQAVDAEKIAALFTAKKKPSLPDAAPVVSPPVSEVSLTLRGILIQSDQRSALLEAGNANNIVRVFQGEETAGWKLETIAPDYVELLKGSERKKLWLPDISVQDQVE